MRIDTSEPSLVSLFEKGQVGLIRTEFMRKDDVIASLVEKNAALAAERDYYKVEAEKKWHLANQDTLNQRDTLQEQVIQLKIEIEELKKSDLFLIYNPETKKHERRWGRAAQ